MMRRCAVALCTVLSAAPVVAQQEAYPAKPIRLIVPSPPGASNDGIARIVANGINQSLGRPIVVDNRAGGGGIIASELVARARPDGYTLLLAYAAFTTTPFLQANMPYDVLKDFAPITEIANQPLFLVVNTAIPVNSVKELVALAKSRAGGLMAGYTQSGSSTHLATEIFKLKTGTINTITSVSYKGGAPVQVALMSGEVQLSFATATSTLPQINSGRIRVIATSAAKRLSYAPEVPTLAEEGVLNLDAAPWQGLLAPAGTPHVIVARIHAEIVRLLKLKESQERLAALGADPVGSTPEEFRSKLATELQEFGRIIPALGLKRQ